HLELGGTEPQGSRAVSHHGNFCDVRFGKNSRALGVRSEWRGRPAAQEQAEHHAGAGGPAEKLPGGRVWQGQFRRRPTPGSLFEERPAVATARGRRRPVSDLPGAMEEYRRQIRSQPDGGWTDGRIAGGNAGRPRGPQLRKHRAVVHARELTGERLARAARFWKVESIPASLPCA